MTLSKEEIEMIEREAIDQEFLRETLPHSEYPTGKSFYQVGCIDTATKYLLQLKSERERAGKLMEALSELVKWCNPDERWNYMAAIENAQKLINEYKNVNQ